MNKCKKILLKDITCNKIFYQKNQINQLFCAPLSIQQSIEFFCAVVMEPVFGMRPVAIAVLISDLAAEIAA